MAERDVVEWRTGVQRLEQLAVRKPEDADASGAIADSGTYARTDVHATPSLPDCFCPLDHPGALSETFLLTGSGGTLTITAEEVVTPNGEPGGQVNGVWQVRSGTGGYASASGHGTDFFGPPFTLYLTGVMSKAG